LSALLPRQKYLEFGFWTSCKKRKIGVGGNIEPTTYSSVVKVVFVASAAPRAEMSQIWF
jgi:hypothetical protein